MEQPEKAGVECKLTLHPEAKKSYDERGETLLQEVSVTSRPQQAQGFVPDMPIAATFTSDQISNLVELVALPNGRVTQRTFPLNGKNVGLKDEAYKNFMRLCEKVQKNNPVRKYVSLSVIEELAFEWVRDRYTGASNLSFTDYILPKFEAMIREYEIWIPIYHTHVSHDLLFGDVTIKTFTATMFDALRDDFRAHTSPDEEKVIGVFDEWQRKYQSMAAATMFVEAEPKRAYEIVREEAEKALAILRLYSQAAFIPEVMSCCVLMGQKEAQSETYFAFHEGQIHASPDGMSGIEQQLWVIGPDQLDMMKMTIGPMVALFFKENRTPFEQDVCNSIMMYSRGLVAFTPSDKLMYIFSALESLLLKNNTEAIGANVPRRVAFIVAAKANERKEIIKTYGKAYDLRSQFVHHGESVDDFEVLTKFLNIVWQFFFGLVLREISKYKTTVEFLDALELIALSGGSVE